MNRTLEQIREELEAERLKLEDLNKKGYLGRQLFDIMTRMFDLMREEEQIIKQQPRSW